MRQCDVVEMGRSGIPCSQNNFQEKDEKTVSKDWDLSLQPSLLRHCNVNNYSDKIIYV